MISSRRRKIPTTKLVLDDTELLKTTRLKVLGLTFVPKLTWKPYVQDLYVQCKKKVEYFKSSSSKQPWSIERCANHNVQSSYSLQTGLCSNSLWLSSEKHAQTIRPHPNHGSERRKRCILHQPKTEHFGRKQRIAIRSQKDSSNSKIYVPQPMPFK